MRDPDKLSTGDTGQPVLQAGSRDNAGMARQNAIRALQQYDTVTTSVVEYLSQGRLAIIGPQRRALPIADALQTKLPSIIIIDTEPGASGIDHNQDIVCLRAEIAELRGHLGDFHLELRDRGAQTITLQKLLGRQWERLDLILDIQPEPCIDAQVPPPGYYATRNDENALASYLDEIPNMLGEFQKPRYFDYDPSICAHSRNRITACSRCIDACPTLAIHSLGERIEVDPYLCQGGGTCAAVCPSGAIRYVYPDLANLLARLRAALRAYHQTGGRGARLVFTDTDHTDSLEALLQEQHSDVDLIPVVMDELGALDIAIMLNSIAYGARQVIVLLRPSLPQLIRDTLESQQMLAEEFLHGLGYNDQRIVIVPDTTLPALLPSAEIDLPPAAYASFSDKRTMLRMALEHLFRHAPLQNATLELPPTAPFGEILINREACTLCLSCTGVCPTKALAAGGDSPRLSFIEDLCVQCGLCEKTCPEHAIQRHQRYLFDEEHRRSRRELNSESAFCCIRCGKPFATRQLIKHMQARLAGHWMYDNTRAQQRLQMCEDCRIADLWDEQNV